MQGVLSAHRETFREIEQLPPVRAATRQELYQRIYRARDFMAATVHQPLTLDEIAKIACLSTNHFLRSFKQIFGQTPHQYLTALRLEKAQKLLKKTDLPIIQICQTVGFESHSSFSLLFRRHFGISPEKFRREKGDFR
jgi:transcriptional regulator GlxA family with amidase domain